MAGKKTAITIKTLNGEQEIVTTVDQAYELEVVG